MKNIIKALAYLFLVMIISACGGSSSESGSGNSQQVIDENGRLLTTGVISSFYPAKIQEKVGEGDTIQFTVTAELREKINTSVYIVVSDGAGSISTEIELYNFSQTEYLAVLNSSPSLSLGVHSGELIIRLCQDQACSAQYSGSPYSLDYEFEVISNTYLKPLKKLSGANDWEGYQGNASHTAYVPATLDASKFTPRWRWSTPLDGVPDYRILNGNVSTNTLVTADDSVFVTTALDYANRLYALNEYDGSIRWQQDIPGTANPPGVSAGKVYVATTGHSNTFMWSFDSINGTELSSVAFASQWDKYYAPTIYAGDVVSPGGYYGGMIGYNFLDGSNKWSATSLQFDRWTPAIDENYIYYYSGYVYEYGTGHLKAINKTDGTEAFRIYEPSRTYDTSNPFFGVPCSQVNETPVISDVNSIITLDGRCGFNFLTKYNLETRTVDWSIAGPFTTPAVANNVVYTLNVIMNQLEAHSVEDGSLLWSWKPQGGYVYSSCFANNIVATDNMVFISLNNRVFAIDINTRKEVWKYWKSGSLAISNNGLLYIKTIENSCNGSQDTIGDIVAINLQ